MYVYMPCSCDYSAYNNSICSFCSNCDSADLVQKRIWNQVRVPASDYVMNLSAMTSAANRLASEININWQQMSDRVNPAEQPTLVPTKGNSLHRTLTSDRPGASTPGGKGVDVKHDSYARYLNRKKGMNIQTQTKNIAANPMRGNKTYAIGILGNNYQCCN